MGILRYSNDILMRFNRYQYLVGLFLRTGKLFSVFSKIVVESFPLIPQGDFYLIFLLLSFITLAAYIK